jgi:hypothetical protein
MKASELRIGNLVYKNGIATEITADTMLDILRYTTPFEPIRLTEDIVIDLGLNAVELENGEWFYQNSKFRLNKNYAGFYYSKNLNIKYVHQLQNLYFALTGEELTIKE